MFITKKHLPRRTVLRGLGAALALPLLDAMVPASTALAKTAARAKPFVGFFYLPHGAIMENWTPASAAPGFAFSPILKPLEPFRDRITVVSGLDNKPAVSNATHAIVPGTWLSSVHPRKGVGPDDGITADQIAARHLGDDTPLPSLEISTEGKGGSAACAGAYGCSWGNTISFRTPTTPLPMEYIPRKLFARLFGQGDSAEQRAAIAGENRSLVDMVMGQARELGRRLGTPDRVVLDGYLESVREIERRIARAEQHEAVQAELPQLPSGVPSFDDRLMVMFDMLAVAYQTGLTRVGTYMMAAEVSNQAYLHLGISEAFHPLSHHNNAPDKLAKLTTLQTYHSQAMAKFLAKVAAMPHGDGGSILDQAIFLYGSNMSNSALHDHFPLPAVVMGGGCGRLKGNQHLRYPDHTPHANLVLTLLQRAGVPKETLGDSTGVFAEI